MVNKLLAILAIIIPSVLYAQPYKEDGGVVLRDVIDSSKVLKILDRVNEDNKGNAKDIIEVYYYDVKDTADILIEFQNGFDYFREFVDSCYYASFRGCLEEEVNRHVLYSILFDESAHIVDIRMLDDFSSRILKPYHELIKQCILATEGKWYKSKKRRKYSIHLFPMRIAIVPVWR